MPRRLPVRPAKVFGNFFVLIVLSLMVLIWYTNVIIIWVPKASKYYLLITNFISKLRRQPCCDSAINHLQLFLLHAGLVLFLDDDY